LLFRILISPQERGGVAEWMAAWFVYYKGFAATLLERSSVEWWKWRAWGSAATASEPSYPRLRREAPIGHSKAIHTGRNNQDPAVRPNGRRVSRSIRDLGKGTHFDLASRAGPTPQETDESQKYWGTAAESPPMDLRIEGKPIEGASHQFMRGCAKNRRRTRGV